MGDLFNRPFNFRIGYRYEETDVTSSAESQSYTRIEWASTNEFTAVPSEDAIATGLMGNYDASLPNVDFYIEIIDINNCKRSADHIKARMMALPTTAITRT